VCFARKKQLKCQRLEENLVPGRKHRDSGAHVSFSGTIMCLKSSVAAPSKAAQPREWVLIRTGNFSLSYFGCGGAKLREASRTT